MIPLVPIAIAAGVAWLATRPASEDSPVTGTSPAAREKRSHKRKSESGKGAHPTTSGEIEQVSDRVPYSVAWYRDWSNAMGVEAPIPQTWIENFGEDKAVRYGADHHAAFSLVETANGRRAWLGKGSAGNLGEPKAFAQEFVSRGAIIGPSPSAGGTKHVWGPWHNLSAEGARRAEALNYWPVDYTPSVDSESVNKGIPNKRRAMAASIIKALGSILSIIPVVGPILNAALQVVGGAVGGKKVDLGELTSEINKLYTGLAGPVPEPVLQAQDMLSKAVGGTNG